MTDSTARCWGAQDGADDPDAGEVLNSALDGRASSLVPTTISGLVSAGCSSVSAGPPSCALTAVGGVQCWGSNDFGELGNGTATGSVVPVEVLGF